METTKIGVIPWAAIEQCCIAGMTNTEAAAKFGVKADTVQRRALRHKWTTPLAVAKRSAQLARETSATVETVAQDWLEKGEAHRIKAFDIASESVAKFKPKAPKSFRELESADRIARRAAGLDVADTVVATLLQINERVDNFDNEPEEISPVIEAEVIPEAPAQSPPANPQPAETPVLADQLV
jgi:hypothetical protein